jgi:hypothetical protein
MAAAAAPHAAAVRLAEEVAMIKQNTVSSKTRELYRNSITSFLTWAYAQHPDLLDERFVAAAAAGGQLRRDAVKAWLVRAPADPPIRDFGAFTVDIIEMWLASLRAARRAWPFKCTAAAAPSTRCRRCAS